VQLPISGCRIHLIFFDKETLVHSLPFITLEFKFNAAVGFAEMNE
jgi:hypothetical protein